MRFIFLLVGLASCLPSMERTSGTLSPVYETDTPTARTPSPAAALAGALPALPEPLLRSDPLGKEVFVTSAMTGLYPSLESICGLLLNPETYPEMKEYWYPHEDYKLKFYCKEGDSLPGLKEPYLSAQLITSGWSFIDYRQQKAFVAIQTKEGWFLYALYNYVNPGGHGFHGQDQGVSSFSMVSLTKGAPVILAKSRYSDHSCDWYENICRGDDEEALVLCGIGSSQKPSCTSPIQISAESRTYLSNEDEPSKEKPQQSVDWSLYVDFLDDGRISVSSQGELPREQRGMLGKFSLFFL